MSFADIYANMFLAIVAPSSVFHKTAALAKARETLRAGVFGDLLLSELMTSEGLLKQLQTRPHGVVLRDEIGTLFGSHNTKYLRTLKPDLTALYDCYPYSRRLSNEEIKVETPYLNILGATTPTRFYENVTLTDWQDGFLARWLFVLPRGEPNFDAGSTVRRVEYDQRLAALGTKLGTINKRDDTDFVLEGEAFNLWDKWQRNNVKTAYLHGDDVITALVSRYNTYALKFALILSAINDSWGKITEVTMATAMALADSYKADVHKLLSEKDRYGISGAKLQKVFATIRPCIDLGITTVGIYQRTNMTRGEAKPVLEQLEQMGAVRTEKSGRGVRYFPTTDRLPIKAW
jgi:hypothetical protein